MHPLNLDLESGGIETLAEPGVAKVGEELYRMAFTNEYISEEDIKKFGIEEIDKRYRKAHYKPDWTVDRDENIYLRHMRVGREELCNHAYFTFYWGGELIDVELKRRGEGVRGGKGTTTWTLVILKLPDVLKDNKPEIIENLKAALKAFGESGVLSSVVEHTATFEF